MIALLAPIAAPLAAVAVQPQHAGWLVLLPLLPFLGFVVNAVLGLRLQRRLGRGAVHAVAIAAVAASCGVALVALLRLLQLPEWLRALEQPLWRIGGGDAAALLAVGELGFGLLLDPLSMTLVLLITGIGTLIHVYATGYMAQDPAAWRFFAFLNLFVAAMLLLVLADGLFTLFFGWEGVGLASWGLIGFWYEDPPKARAALKAFVVNRVGDVGLLLAMFLLLAAQQGAFGFAGKLTVPSLAFRELDALAPLLASLELGGVPVLTL
ncbi:MAG: proton-conducting transporter membrane subunit, partial [Myxococcales bacterium]